MQLDSNRVLMGATLAICTTDCIRFGTWRTRLPIAPRSVQRGRYCMNCVRLVGSSLAAIRGSGELCERAHQRLGCAVVRTQPQDEPATRVVQPPGAVDQPLDSPACAPVSGQTLADSSITSTTKVTIG